MPATGQERVDGNRFANTRYGVEIAKPAGWYFITAGAILDLARRTAGTSAPRSDADPVRTTGFAVVVSKTPTLGRGFEPHVILLIRDVPEGSGDLAQACERLRSGMSEPQTVKPTRPARVGAHPAVRLDFQGGVDGALVRATALCVVRERQAFVVVGQALAGEFDGMAASFEQILGSFQLR